MNFKMSAKDFEQLAKFIDKKAKGSTLTFKADTDHKLEVNVTLADGDNAVITFQAESLNAFPKITRQRNLGDEL
jgi:hypothetical protein